MSTRRRRATTATATTSRDDDALAEELFRSLRDAVRARAREANARRRTTDDSTDGFMRRFFGDFKGRRRARRGETEEATDGEARRANEA
jgi:hypothetical protein